MGGGSIRVGSDDLEWPWKAGRATRGQIFQRDLLYARTVWVERPNSAHTGEECISRGSSTPPPQGAGPQRSPILGFPHIYLAKFGKFVCQMIWAYTRSEIRLHIRLHTTTTTTTTTTTSTTTTATTTTTAILPLLPPPPPPPPLLLQHHHY